MKKLVTITIYLGLIAVGIITVHLFGGYRPARKLQENEQTNGINHRKRTK